MMGLRLNLALAAAAMVVSAGARAVEIADDPWPSDALRSAAPPPRRRHRSEPGFVAAPVGRNHPDYGLSLEEHLARKAQRETAK